MAGNIPEFLDVDISNLELDKSVRLSQIVLPEGVEIPGLDEEHDQQVLIIQIPKIIEEPTEEVIPEEASSDLEVDSTSEASSESEDDKNEEES